MITIVNLTISKLEENKGIRIQTVILGALQHDNHSLGLLHQNSVNCIIITLWFKVKCHHVYKLIVIVTPIEK